MDDINELPKWLVTAGLYQSVTLTEDEVVAAAVLWSGSVKIDVYCPGCKGNSTFTQDNNRFFNEDTANKLVLVGGKAKPEQAWEHLSAVLRMPHFYCARNRTHLLGFWLRFWEKGGSYLFAKIGQWPSGHDLAAADIQRYSRLLSASDVSELQAASICHSAGYSVAAFTYLRRVFERRIEVAHDLAKKDTDWQEAGYSPTAYMEERIEKLRKHLPEFLVEHKKLYNILSRGIHELSEEECADGYEVVRLGITLILDEEIERKARSDKIAAASKNLKQLHEKFAS